MKDDFYRTLVRVAGFNDEKTIIYIMVMGWNYGVLVPLSVETLPENMQNHIENYSISELTEDRFFVEANLHAEHSKKLILKDWDIPEVRNPFK